MQILDYENEIIVAENEKWFKFYVKFPLIMAIAVGLIFFIWGIVDPASFQLTTFETSYGYGSEPVENKLYGIMGLETFFGAMIVWWIIGAVLSVGSYFFYKIILAPTILNIFYLKIISQNSGKMLVSKSSTKSPTQTKFSTQSWTCPKCGEKNSYSAKNCTNCFEEKP